MGASPPVVLGNPPADATPPSCRHVGSPSSHGCLRSRCGRLLRNLFPFWSVRTLWVLAHPLSVLRTRFASLRSPRFQRLSSALPSLPAHVWREWGSPHPGLLCAPVAAGPVPTAHPLGHRLPAAVEMGCASGALFTHPCPDPGPLRVTVLFGLWRCRPSRTPLPGQPRNAISQLCCAPGWVTAPSPAFPACPF